MFASLEEKGETRFLSVPSEERNDFDILMASSHKIELPLMLPPPEGKELRKDQQLYNDLIGMYLTFYIHCLNICIYYVKLVG